MSISVMSRVWAAECSHASTQVLPCIHLLRGDGVATLNIRGVDDEVARSFSGAAAARGWTQAEYLRQLVHLHSFVRLDYRLERWEWTPPEGVDEHGCSPEEAVWRISGTTPEEFSDELGRYLSKTHLLAVTT